MAQCIHHVECTTQFVQIVSGISIPLGTVFKQTFVCNFHSGIISLEQHKVLISAFLNALFKKVTVSASHIRFNVYIMKNALFSSSGKGPIKIKIRSGIRKNRMNDKSIPVDTISCFPAFDSFRVYD